MRIRAVGVLLLGIAANFTIFADLLVSQGAAGVDRYTNDGVFLGTVVAAGAGGLGDAQGVAVNANGNMFVGDFNNDNVLQFDSTGAFVGVFASGPSLKVPFDVVFGPDGKMYVANAGGLDSIAQIDPVTGAVLVSSFTSGNVTPIGGPQYIAFGPVLAITDIAGHLFQFDPVTGVHISTKSLDNPEGVAFNSAGDLFVAQRITNNVLRFPFGGGPSEIVIPTGAFSGEVQDIAFGPNGLLYVSASQVYRFDVSAKDGVLVDSFGTGGEFLTFTPVPEPGTKFLLLVAAAFALAYFRIRGYRRHVAF